MSSAGGWSASRVLLCVRVRRLGAFGFMEVVSSILPQFLGYLGVLVPGVCACSLLSIVLYT